MSALELDSETKRGLQQCLRKPWPSMSVRSPSSFLAGRCTWKSWGMTAHIQALPKWGGEPGRWAGAAGTQDTPAFRYLLGFAILASTRHFQSPNLPSGHVPCTHYHILAFLTPSQVPFKPHPSTAVASRVRPVTLILVLEAAGRGQDRDWAPTSSLPPRCHEPRVR